VRLLCKQKVWSEFCLVKSQSPERGRRPRHLHRTFEQSTHPKGEYEPEREEHSGSLNGRATFGAGPAKTARPVFRGIDRTRTDVVEADGIIAKKAIQIHVHFCVGVEHNIADFVAEHVLGDYRAGNGICAVDIYPRRAGGRGVLGIRAVARDLWLPMQSADEQWPARRGLPRPLHRWSGRSSQRQCHHIFSIGPRRYVDGVVRRGR